MVKFKTSVLLISSLLIAVVTAALTYLGLAATGVIEAGKIEIVIQIEDDEKVYDGKALYASSFKLVSGELAETHEIVVEYTSSQINVGRTAALGTARVINENKTDVTKDYDIEVIEGSLSVTPRPITVKVMDESKVYDGTPINATDIQVTSGALVAGHVAHPNFSVVDANKNAGKYLCNLTASIVDGSGEDVSSNYTITSETGMLTIDKAPLVIRSKSTEVDYSNNIDVDFSYEVLSGGLIDGDYVSSVQYETPKDLKPGTNTIKISNVVVNDLENKDVTGNYYIIVQNTGILTVNKYVLDITVKDSEFTYDGKEKYSTDHIIDSSDISYLGENEFTVEAGTIVKLTDAGMVANKLEFRVYDSGKNEITDYFIINQTTGFLKVNKALVSVSLDSDTTYNYDGEAKLPTLAFELKNVESEESANPVISLDEVNYKLKYAPKDRTDYFTDSIPVDAGEYFVMIYSAEFNSDSKYYKNYEIEIPSNSYLNYTISPKTIVYEWKVDSSQQLISYYYNNTNQHPNIIYKEIKDSDGNNTNIVLEDDNVEIKYNYYTIAEDDPTNLNKSDSSINAGTYMAEPVFTGDDVANYKFESSSSNSYLENNYSPVYTILPKTLMLYWEDSKFEYNGSAQYPLLKINDTDFYEDDDLEFNYTILDSNDEDSESINVDMYSIEFELGGSDAENYLINLGQNEISTSYEITPKEANLVFNNTYEMMFIGSDYEINPNDIASATGILENHSLIIDGDSFITIDNLLEVANLKKDAEPISREFKLKIADENGVDVTDNYDIKELSKNVEMKYTKPSITYYGGYISKVYDGTPIVLAIGEEKYDGYAASTYFDIYMSTDLPSYCISVYEFSESDELESGAARYIGATNVDDNLEIDFDVNIYLKGNTLKNVTDLYDIDVEYGSSEIIPKDLSISIGNYTKTYDGEPFESENVYPTIIGAANGEYSEIYDDVIDGLSIPNDSDQVGVHEITGSYTNSNYNISYNNGSVTVNRAKVKVSTLSYVMTYSGEPLEEDVEITVDDPTGTYDESDFNVTYDEYVNVGTYKLTPTSDTVDEAVYDLEVSSGTLTISKKEATISLGTYSKEYDGTEFTEADVDNVVATGFIDDDYAEENLNIKSFIAMNANTYTIKGIYNDQTKNYNVTVLDGVLTITKKEATISLGTYSKEYDGTEFTEVDVNNVVATGFIDDDYVEENLNIKSFIAKNANTYTITGVYNDQTKNYNVTVLDGTLTISKKSAVIKLGTYSKEYDGTEFTEVDVNNVVATGFIDDDYVEENLTINQFVAKDANTYTITGVYNDQTKNYNVTVLDGVLTISKKSAVIKLGTLYSKEYDSNPFDVSEVEPVDSGFIDVDYDENSLSINVPSNVNAGTYEITGYYNDKTNNYNVTVLDGSVTITPMKLTITLGDYSREYIEDDYFTYEDMDKVVIPSELPGDQGLKVSINVTNAGTYTIYGTADYGSNYDVTVVSGTLTIVPVTIMVSVGNYTIAKGMDFDESYITLTYNRSGFEMEDGEYSINCNYDPDTSNSGVYTIDIIFDATQYHPNYYVIGVPGTLTVI